jgi:hypothetical protein
MLWGIVYGLMVGLTVGFLLGNANGITLCKLNHNDSLPRP